MSLAIDPVNLPDQSQQPAQIRLDAINTYQEGRVAKVATQFRMNIKQFLNHQPHTLDEKSSSPYLPDI